MINKIMAQTRTLKQGCLVIILLMHSVSSIASETLNFDYNQLGRLVRSTSSGSVNNGLNIQYTIDEAGNRKRVVIAGSSNQGIPTEGVIVVPLNGFTVIPIGQ
jgi:hypothetical protein